MRRRGLSFEQLLIALLFLAIGATACLAAAQNDTYWHLRAGQQIWQFGKIPLEEAFSHTWPGRYWPNHAWAWQALSYGLYALGGFPLLTAAASLVVLGAHWLVYKLMRGGARLRFILLALALPLTCLVWALRPQIVSLLMLPLLLTLLERRRFAFALIPVVFAAWANFHGAVALGGAVLCSALVVAVVAHRSQLVYLVPVLLLSALATALTPMGTGLWTYIGESIGRSTDIQIEEWRAVTLGEFAGVGFYAVLVALAILLARHWRRLDTWGDHVLLAATLTLLPLAIRFGRNIPPFLLVAAPLASRLLAARDADQAVTPLVTRSDDRPRLNLAIFAVAAVAMASGVGYAWTQRLQLLGWDRIPARAVSALEHCPGRLYNRYDDGGFLVWYSQRTPVYIDSRQDPFPPDFVATHVKEEHVGVEPAVLQQRGLRCAFLPPRSPTTRKVIAAGWQARYRDEDWLVLEAPR